jgi:hypothetical protein
MANIPYFNFYDLESEWSMIQKMSPIDQVIHLLLFWFSIDIKKR